MNSVKVSAATTLKILKAVSSNDVSIKVFRSLYYVKSGKENIPVTHVCQWHMEAYKMYY